MRRVLPPLLVTPKASKMVSQRRSISVSRIFSLYQFRHTKLPLVWIERVGG
jgi:hypothetical protein